MKFSPLLSLASAAALLMGSTSASLTLKDKANVVPGRYLIEFSDNNVSTNSKKLVTALKGKFEKNKMDIVNSFDHSLFRAVSLQIDSIKDASVDTLSAENASSLKSILKAITEDASVSNVYPVHVVPRPKVISSMAASEGLDPTLLLPHAMTQVDIVHKKLKNNGKGITVGVLDSGVDYLHPALGGGFGKGFKVALGRDLVGDDYDWETNPVPKPDDDPLDNCGASSGASGHGTHVSGIIAGKSDNFTGVAPEATLGMWRVFGCTGSVSDDIIIEAMLDAYDSGVDIISMSLGDTTAWSETADAVVASRIVAKNVPVIIAAGNEGTSGVFTVSAPSVGHGVTSVASFDNNYSIAKAFNISGVDESFFYLPSSPSSGDFPSDAEVVAGDVNIGSTADGCTAANIPSSVKGKVGLIQRGSCTFDEKAANLHAAGAIGVLVYNSGVGDIYTPSTTETNIPLAGISHSTGVKLAELIKAGTTVEATFHSESSLAPAATGGTVSSFSSVGPSYEIDFKPDFGGIGGGVYSTLPRYLGGWGVMSGTSMATPYVAGAFALYLKQAESSKILATDPLFINEKFKNFAKKGPNPIIGGVESPFVQGAGLLQVYDTLMETGHISPSHISFNDTANIVPTHKLTITNNGNTIVSYKLLNNITVSVIPYDTEKYGYLPQEPVQYGEANAGIRFSKKTLRLAPGKSATIKVTVTPPKTDPTQHIQYGGFIQFKSLQPTAHKDLTVPYIGIVGTESKLPIFLDETPYVTDVNEEKQYIKNDVYTFDISNSTTAPYIVYGLQTASAQIKATLETVHGLEFGTVLSDAGLTYVRRNTLEVPYSAVSWDGTYKPSIGNLVFPITLKAPKGKYRIKWKALKLLGNPRKSSDWETWTSAIIQIV